MINRAVTSKRSLRMHEDTHKVRDIENAVGLCCGAVDDKLVRGLLLGGGLPLHQSPFLHKRGNELHIDDYETNKFCCVVI